MKREDREKAALLFSRDVASIAVHFRSPLFLSILKGERGFCRKVSKGRDTTQKENGGVATTSVTTVNGRLLAWNNVDDGATKRVCNYTIDTH